MNACFLLIGERNLFCLNENGKLRYMKKLDYDPSCFIPYGSSEYIKCTVNIYGL